MFEINEDEFEPQEEYAPDMPENLLKFLESIKSYEDRYKLWTYFDSNPDLAEHMINIVAFEPIPWVSGTKYYKSQTITHDNKVFQALCDTYFNKELPIENPTEWRLEYDLVEGKCFK